MKKELFSQLIVVMLGVAAGAGTPITCSAGDFSRCTNASVTCNFQENIKHSKKNFNIVQYPFNKEHPNSDSGTYVLVCNWGSGDSLDCKSEAGFIFNKQVSNTVTLDIPDVTASVGGVYVCQVVPDSGVPLETCTLRVKNYEPPPMQNVCTPVNCGREDLIIAVLILLMILLSAGFVVVVIYVKTRYSLVQKRGDPARDQFICCGSTFAIERRHHKQPNLDATAPKAKGMVATVNPQAVTYVKNEAGRQKGSDVTDDAAPLLAALKTAELAGSDKNDIEGLTKTDAGKRSANSLHHVHQHQTPMDNEKRSMSVQERTLRPTYEDDEDGQARTHGDRDPKSSEGENYNAQAQKQASTAGKSTNREPERLKALGYGSWTTDQVCTWLAQEQIDDGLIERFRENKVTGKDLVKNKKSVRQKLGRAPSERILINEKIKALQKGARTESEINKAIVKKNESVIRRDLA